MRYKWPLAYQTSASIFIMFSLIQCVSFSFLLSLSVSWARTRYNFQRSGESALYLIFSFAMLLVGGVMALLIRAELFKPGLQIMRPEFFNQLTTMHGIVMV